MIACCIKCARNFETTEEDANDPGPDLRGPRCPSCYARERQADNERRRLGLPTIAGSRAMFAAIDRANENRRR